MDGDVEEEGRAAEATPGVPKVPLLLCSFSWALIFLLFLRVFVA